MGKKEIDYMIQIKDTQMAIVLISLMGLAVFVYGYLTGTPINDGLVYTAMAAISGLSGFEIGKKVI